MIQHHHDHGSPRRLRADPVVDPNRVKINNRKLMVQNVHVYARARLDQDWILVRETGLQKSFSLRASLDPYLHGLQTYRAAPPKSPRSPAAPLQKRSRLAPWRPSDFDFRVPGRAMSGHEDCRPASRPRGYVILAMCALEQSAPNRVTALFGVVDHLAFVRRSITRPGIIQMHMPPIPFDQKTNETKSAMRDEQCGAPTVFQAVQQP